MLKIEREGGMYFASNDTLSVCGYGATAKESVDQAIMHIVYFREYYQNLPEDKAIGEAMRLKQAFR